MGDLLIKKEFMKLEAKQRLQAAERPSLDEAKNKYPHRYTMEHVPEWARKPADNGKYYAPQYRSDKEWYDNTEFPTNPREKHCQSNNPSWPKGQWLDKPFTR